MFVSKRKFNAVKRDLDDFKKHFNNFVTELNNNGVATAINKVNKELFDDKKYPEQTYGERLFGLRGSPEPTIKAKVEAILNHLGLDVTVHTTPAKSASTSIKVTQRKKTTRKK